MFYKINNTKLYFSTIVLSFLFFDSQYLPGANFALLFLFINLIYLRKVKLLIGKMQWFFLLYILYLLFITILNFQSNYDISNSRMYFVEISIIVFFMYFYVHQLDLLYFLRLLRNFGVCLAILGCLEGIVKYPFLSIFLNKPCETAFDPSGYRIVSIFGHPIISGVFYMLSWCVSILFLKKNFGVNCFIHFVFIAAIILTRSRSVWLSFSFVFFILLLKFFKLNISSVRYRTAYRIICIVAIIFFCDFVTSFSISKGLYDFLSSRIVGSLYAGEGAGNIIRIDTVLNSINYWNNGNLDKFLFGMGKNYDKFFMQLFPVIKFSSVWTAAIDNQYFTILHESGLIGLIFIISVVLLAFYRIFQKKQCNFISLSSNCCVIGIFVSMYFYEGLNYLYILILLVIFIYVSDSTFAFQKLLTKRL